MYCPNCGRQAIQGQRFCKSCGFNLATLTHSLGGPLVTPEEARESRRRLEDVRQGMRTMFMGIGLMIFFALFFHSLGFAAIGAIVFFKGLGQMASATVFATPPRSVEFRWPGTPETHRISPPPSVVTAPAHPESTPPSVTEHTTIRLESPEYEPPREQQRTAE